MRVLQVYPYYPPAWEYGGALRVVHHTATKLAERGHETVVYTTDSAGSDGRIDAPVPTTRGGVTVHYFPNVSNTLARKHHVPLPVGLGSTLWTDVDDFDVVHIHGMPHLLAWMSAVMALRRSVPYVLTPHGTINRPGDDGSPLKAPFERLLGRTVVANADRIIALTDAERTRLLEYGVDPARIVQIRNGMTTDTDVSEADARAFREQYGYTDCWLVVFVGRLHHSKGLDELLETARRLDGTVVDGKPVKFAAIGPDDGYQATLESGAAELSSLDVLGFVSEAEKDAALAAADLYVLPSRGEGQPMSVLEACAAGTPSFISEETSLPEVAEHGAGQVLERDPEVFASAIETALENDAEREQMGRRASAMIETAFSWDAVVGDLESLYHSVQDR